MQAAALLPIEASQKQQGKGTANHMMPLNNWFRGNMESSLIQYHLLSPFTPEVVHHSSPQNLILICQLYYWQKKTVTLNEKLVKCISPDMPSDHQRHLAKCLNLND